MKPPTPGLEPVDWPIRTCPEGDVVANLLCWLWPTLPEAAGAALIREPSAIGAGSGWRMSNGAMASDATTSAKR